jgi:ABC-type lipoprotein release transport system permease subunit
MNSAASLARSGFGAVVLHPLRSAATTACVAALLLPFVVGLAISQGLADEADDAARYGADVVVSGLRYGRSAPLPVAAADMLRAMPGVASVRPRIVAATQMGSAHEDVVVVGIDAASLPKDVACVEGRLFAPGDRSELVVGSRLARRLGLHPGARVPPFHENREGERVSEVVGVFRADLPMWEANVVLTSFETAQRMFDERGTTTQFLVACNPGYVDPVRDTISRLATLGPADSPDPLPPRVLSRADVTAVLARGAAFGAGVFTLHFVLLFAAAIPMLVVASGAGLRERRREVGVLKMLGWGTDDVLVRGFVESLLLAATAAATSVLLAALWLGPLGARGISAVFLPGADADPGFGVAWRLTPGPVVIAAALASVLIFVGTLPSNWRAASAEPMESMR